MISPPVFFPDGEIKVAIGPECTDRHVFIIQSLYPNPNDRLIELLLMIDAAKRGSAKEITAIIPYLAYSRQDRKTQPREPISVGVVLKTIEEVGANRIITMDLHAEQSSAAVNIPVDIVYASFVFKPKLLQILDPDNLVVVSPDVGGLKRARGYQTRLNACGLGSVDKQRDPKTGKTTSFILNTEVEGKDVLLVDDVAVSLGSLRDAARLAKEKGASKIFAAVAHGILIRLERTDSLEILDQSEIDKLLITDSILQPEEVRSHPKIEIVPTVDFWTNIIYSTYNGISLDTLGLFD